MEEAKSVNFQFLANYDRHFVKLARSAEVYCFSEPNIALTRIRQICETIAFRVARYSSFDKYQPHSPQQIYP